MYSVLPIFHQGLPSIVLVSSPAGMVCRDVQLRRILDPAGTFQFYLPLSDLTLTFDHSMRLFCWTSHSLRSHEASTQLFRLRVDVSLNPDAIFPLPNLRGPVNHDHVNLFTGEVNMRVPLANLTGFTAAYQLDAMYNSHSAYLYAQGVSVPPYNCLGGYGWKLMDYPKIVSSGEIVYFLDGYECFLLSRTSSWEYRTGGKYHAWIFLQYIGLSWIIKSDVGTHYALYTDPRWTISSGTPAGSTIAATYEDKSWLGGSIR